MTEVHELLGTDPAVSVYKYGLLEENMNILQVGLGEKDRISQLVVDVLQDASRSGGEAATSLFIRPRIESTSTHGTGCTLSAAIVCGLASGLTSNPSPFFVLVETDHDPVPEAVRDGTVYTHLGILHAFPVGAGYGPLNHAHSMVSRFMPQCVGLHLGSQMYLNPPTDLARVTDTL